MQPHVPEAEFEFLPFLRSPGGALLIAICSIFGGCVWLNHVSSRPYELATFDCGKGRSIVFLMDRECDEAQPIYYTVRASGATVVPLTTCGDVTCGFEGELLLDIRLTADGDVVGIFDPGNPLDYWVVHDFRDGASWPRGDREPKFQGSGSFSRKDLEDLLNNAARHKP
jgi:hypothetical protein